MHLHVDEGDKTVFDLHFQGPIVGISLFFNCSKTVNLHVDVQSDNETYVVKL